MKIIKLDDYRNKYKKMDMIQLLECVTMFLYTHPSPIKNKKSLQEGINLFNEVYTKCNTVEIRIICLDYLKLYSKTLIELN